MMAVSYFSETFLRNGSGYLMPTLMADFLALIILSCLIIMLIYKPIKNMVEFRKAINQVGGPKGHWFWGDAKKYGFTHEGLMNNIQRMKDFPAMATFYLCFHVHLYFYHPDVVKTLLSRNVPKAWTYKKFLSPILGEGLVTSDGALWKRHRRLLTAIFHFDILKEHCQIFVRNTNASLRSFAELAQKNSTCDVVPVISASSFTNMMECVMSQKAQDDSGQQSHFVNCLRDGNFLLVERQQNPFYWIEAIYKKTKSGKRLKEVQHSLFSEADRIIKERRSLLQSLNDFNLKSETSVITDEETGKIFTFRKRKGKPMDFLDLLLQTKDQNGVGLTDAEIKDEVITFFAAGMETVTTVLTWTFYLLSLHREQQTKCREEINHVIGDKEGLEQSDLSKLTFVTQCIKESMRLFPPVHTMGRQLQEDTVFSHRFNNYKKITLKKGTKIAVSIFALHRNPHVWDNPDKFQPDRFDQENVTNIPPFAFIPFSAGPRNCIGQNFAMVEMKVFLAKILRSFEFLWDPNVPHPIMNPGVTNPPKYGLPLIVKKIS